MTTAAQLRDTYQNKKNREGRRSRDAAAAGQEIGPLPPIKNPVRRLAATKSLKLFCESYFPRVFYLPWSDDQLEEIDDLQEIATNGGLLASAAPRGDGKSARVRTTAIWAIFTGRRRYVAIIGANDDKAREELLKIQTACESNRELIADWPEVLYPIKCLDRITQRQKGQTYLGEHTRISWLSAKLVFPTIPGSKASGAIITAAGLETGSIRGQSHETPEGDLLRPDFTLLDDPQTRESAESDSQCEGRERLTNADVLGMAGPDKSIAAAATVTVIRKGDYADRILDRTKNPMWNGRRRKMLKTLPTNLDLWDQYAELRRSVDDKGKSAAEFYAANYEAMNAGAEASWIHRKGPGELSAIQCAMNIRIDKPEAFDSEYQNSPEERTKGDKQLTADDIANRVNGIERGRVAIEWSRMTAFIDVQKSLLFWAVAAWRDDFAGGIVDYGVFPGQGSSYFTLANAPRTLSREFPNADTEGSIYSGLEALTELLLQKEWQRDGGHTLRIDRLLIDSGWGESTDLIYEFIRRSPHAALMYPSKGMGIGAGAKPMTEYEKRPGEIIGLNWRIPKGDGSRAVRHVLFDSNFWKSFIVARLAASKGSASNLTLFGKDPREHRMFADHLTAEYSVRTFGRGREVTEWKIKPGRPDNHFLDCTVGCAVAASMLGISLPSQRATTTRRKRKISYLK